MKQIVKDIEITTMNETREILVTMVEFEEIIDTKGSVRIGKAEETVGRSGSKVKRNVARYIGRWKLLGKN